LTRSSVVLCFAAVIGQTCGEEYLSNLGDLWPDLTGQTIGDIEVLTSYYGPFVVQFFTGSVTNETKLAAGITNAPKVEAFELTSVTCEFLGSPWQPWSDWSNVTIRFLSR
jgi:hypothetical protein